MIKQLPVNMELSWVPQVKDQQDALAHTQQNDEQEIIRCPLTGEQIPACCCPLEQ